jgi:hypothetical protein
VLPVTSEQSKLDFVARQHPCFPLCRIDPTTPDPALTRILGFSIENALEASHEREPPLSPPYFVARHPCFPLCRIDPTTPDPALTRILGSSSENAFKASHEREPPLSPP